MAKQKNKAKDPESEVESTSCMKTHTRNATIHPGNIVLESGHSRRSKEEVQEEKKQKQARKDAEERQKIQAEAWRKAGNDYIAQLDTAETAAAANAEKDFPRHRSKTQGTVVHSYQTCIS
jgi:hypothetical protein